MKNRMVRLCVVVLALTASSVIFGQTQVPNTFQSGQPARAADVNANFDAIESAIDANTSAIQSNSATVTSNQQSIQDNATSISGLAGGGGVRVYSQGIDIGSFLSMRAVNTSDTGIFVVSPTGYLFIVSTAGVTDDYLHNKTIYFTGTDCTGITYIKNWSSPSASVKNLGQWSLSLGVVIKAGTQVYYTGRGSSGTSFDYQSRNSNSLCVNEVGSLGGYQVFPNNEAVTAVSNFAPIGPLRVGAP